MQNTARNRIYGVSHFFFAIGILLLTMMVLVFVSGALAKAIWGINIAEIKLLSPEELTLSQSYGLKFVQSFTAIGFILASVICCVFYKKKFAEFVGIKNAVRPKVLGLSFLVFLSIIPLISWLVVVNEGIQLPEKYAELFQDLESSSNSLYALLLHHNTGVNFAINLLVMSLLPAIGEELFFRGVLMRVSTRWMGNVHLGILISSLLFALVHFQPYKFIPMVVLAMLFGYLYYRSGSLWVPILLHALNNAMVLIGSLISQSGQTIEPLASDYEFPITTILAALGLGVSAFYLLWKNSNETDFSYE